MFDILVIGSINIDLTTQVEREPKKGETVFGKAFHLSYGGKGANQAVGMVRLGAQVGFLGCIGSDVFGAMLKANLEQQNVNTTYLQQVEGQSGVATIQLDETTKDNKIIVVPNANNLLSKKMVKQAIEENPNLKMVVLQLEIPLNIVEYTIDLCKEKNIKTLLNPAPYQMLSRALIEKTSFLILNEHEHKLMLENDNMYESLANYPLKIIVTKGKDGAVFHDGIDIHRTLSIDVETVDTTGAGDAFVAAFTVAYLQNMKIAECVRVANVCAGLSTTKVGAQEGLPTRKALLKYLENQVES
jgi:ribokinase